MVSAQESLMVRSSVHKCVQTDHTHSIIISGFGGKVEQGETVEEGARRELLEEAEIEAVEMTKIGINLFAFTDDPVGLETHVYIVTSFKGTPKE